jgi:hypothetical protein
MSWLVAGKKLKYVNKPKVKYTANTKEYTKAADLPIIISLGKKGTVLTIEGYIYEAGYTKAQLETSFLFFFRDKVYRSVVISAPDTRYDGSWILTDFGFEEPNVANAFPFTMSFLGGAKYYVVV